MFIIEPRYVDRPLALLAFKHNAVIYVERDSQKGIIIGHQGVALKKVNMESRKSLEKFFNKKIFLETFVKVDKDWRSSQKELDAFGYNPE